MEERNTATDTAHGLTEAVKNCRKDLLAIIDVDFGLLNLLESSDLLTSDQIEDAKCKPTTGGRIDCLLNYVSSFQESKIEEFLSALEHTQQVHVAKYIRCHGRLSETDLDRNEWPFQKCEAEFKCYKSNWSKLVDFIDSEYGLIDELFSIGFLNRQHRESIKGVQGNTKRNEDLLHIVQRKSLAAYNQFITCLHKTKQSHVASVLDGTQGCDWLLSETHQSSLQSNHAVLVELIDAYNGLVSMLYAENCITCRQKESIEAASSKSERNARLLDIICRGSEVDYVKFVDNLSKSGQTHVRRILSEVGAVVHLIAKTNLAENVQFKEKFIVDRLMSLLTSCPKDIKESLQAKVEEILDEFSKWDVHLIAAQPGRSISLYFLCKSSRGLQYISESYGSGQLRTTSEELFKLISGFHLVVVDSLQWNVKNYDSCVQYFRRCSSLKIFKKIYQMAERTRTDCCRRLIDLHSPSLSPELVKTMLLRAACRLFLMIKKETGDVTRSVQCTMATLWAVSKNWRETLSDIRFKRLFQLYSRNAKLLNSLYSLRHELQTYIDIDHGLLDELEVRCVVSNEHIEVLRNKLTIKQRVLRLFSYITVVNMSQFIEALKNTQQCHIAEFIRKQGDLKAIIPGNWPMLACKSKVDLIHQHWSELLSLLDAKTGLLQLLVNTGCLNFQHKEHIEGLDSNMGRNEELLCIICRKSVIDYKKFLDCLLTTKQYYAARLLGVENEGISMLQEETMRNLEVNQSVLVELLDTTSDLLADLLSDGCITQGQKQFIEAATCKSEMNKRLLRTVMHCSQSDFVNFIDCLRRNGQQHVCRIMQNNGVVAHAQVEFSDAQKYAAFIHLLCSRTGIARDIVEHFIDVTDEKMTESSGQPLFRVRSTLFARSIEFFGFKATDSRNIELFFVYRTLNEYYHMYEMCYSGEMNALCKGILTDLSGEHFALNSDDVLWKILPNVRGAQYLSFLAGLHAMSDVYRLVHQAQWITSEFQPCRVKASTQIAFRESSHFITWLPFELMELLVLKAAGFLFSQYNRMTTSAGVCSLLTMSAVSRPWWHSVFRRKYNTFRLRHYFRHTCLPYKRESKKLHELSVDESRGVSGVAELGGLLFIVCRHSNAILIFDAYSPLTPVRCIRVKELKDPSDIVACEYPRRLYVADRAMKCVRRIGLTPHDRRRISTEIDCTPSSLSVNGLDKLSLLVTSHDGAVLYQYDTSKDSTLARITLPRYMKARHAVTTTHDSFIVCHKYRQQCNDAERCHDGISEVDLYGNVLRSFCANIIGDHLNKPLHMALDDEGNLLVADCRNGRVLILSPDLTLKRILLSRCVGQPARMCLSESTGLLFVAGKLSSNIDIYVVQDKPQRVAGISDLINDIEDVTKSDELYFDSSYEGATEMNKKDE